VSYRIVSLVDRSGWAARGKYLASDVVNCTAVLSYTAELVRPGLVSFAYQTEDDSILFTFEARTQDSRAGRNPQNHGRVFFWGGAGVEFEKVTTKSHRLIWLLFSNSYYLAAPLMECHYSMIGDQ